MRYDWDAVIDMLEKPTYTEVLLRVIGGKNNYATSIAKHLKKKQPTVTEQLKEMEKIKLIKPLKREKSKKYEVNWDILLDVFYDIMNEVFEARKDYLTEGEIKRIKKVGLRKIVPPKLIKIFLREYSLTLMDLGGKRKGFDEIIFSFFSALNNLGKPHRQKLIKEFGIDEKGLSILANLMEFEISGIEQTALMGYLSLNSKGDKNG